MTNPLEKKEELKKLTEEEQREADRKKSTEVDGSAVIDDKLKTTIEEAKLDEKNGGYKFFTDKE